MTEHKVKIAAWAVAAAPDRLVTIGLGSCVAILLWEAKHRIGGLAHVLLPEANREKDEQFPGKFAATAVPRMLDEMRALGADGTITARLVGGASLFGGLMTREGAGAIGARNVDASRAALQAARLRVQGEHVGGTAGRSVYFDLSTGRVTVRSMKEGDVEL